MSGWRRRFALLACLAAGAATAQPSFEEVRAAHTVSDAQLLDRHGVPLQTLRTDARVRRLAWLPLAEVSPALRQAIVLSEDRRFWAHSGVDWAAVAAAAWGNLVDQRTRGASTLTMQLAGLMESALARPPGGRSHWQKLEQAVLARRIEARWSKSQILEAYLNSVPLRGEMVGVGAIAQTLFGKHASGLDEHEAAIVAALVRGPNAAPAVVGERACGVLRAMQRDCAGVRTQAALALARQGGMPLGEQLAPHYARLSLRAAGPRGGTRGSTLDAGLQRVAIAALRDQLAELQGRQVEDGAVIVLDNASGEVRAWVGANGRTSAAAQVDGVLARRQPGSTLKPFVYGLAFERRLLTPATLLDDSPAQISTAGGLYLPQNYDRQHRGWVSVRQALGASLNIPAVRAASMLPPDALHARLNALGLSLRESAGWYGSALALGGAEVTLLDLANAYRTLANGGLFTAVPLPGRPRGAPRQVMDPAVAWLLGDILADPQARVATFGIDNPLRTRGFAAVKTGTSKDLRDSWCVGYTDRYTVAVWVGNASGQPMHDVSGVGGAAPVWQALVRHLHQGQPSVAPARPAGIVTAAVRWAGDHEAPRREAFLAGTAPRDGGVTALRARGDPMGITSPTDGSLFALDPDIPPQAQRITFAGERGTWAVDGRVVGHGEQLHWPPWPGRHRLELRAADGRVLQAVRFEVRGLRGAAARPAPRPAARPAAVAAAASAR